MYYAATYPILNHVESSAFGFITCRRFRVAVKRTSHARVHRQSAPVNGNARHILRWYICMPTHAPISSSACSAKESTRTKEKLQTTFRARGIRKKRVLLTFERGVKTVRLHFSISGCGMFISQHNSSTHKSKRNDSLQSFSNQLCGKFIRLFPFELSAGSRGSRFISATTKAGSVTFCGIFVVCRDAFIYRLGNFPRV